jgi:uncharacterized membrane protein
MTTPALRIGGFPRDEGGERAHSRAWLALVGALGLHVIDEALTGFLDFYNPLVLSIRAGVPWFPMPTFTFGPWISGLAALVVLLALLTPAIRRGAPGTLVASWILASLMFLNGLGHLVGSVYFGRWLPGATSAPLLLATSVWLARASWTRTRRTGQRA